MDLLSGTKIHEGKFSIIYLVEHRGEKFIVKQLHPRLAQSVDAISQFRLEAQMPDLGGIHPRTIDYREYLGGHYLVREYVQGITLKLINREFTKKKYRDRLIQLYIQLCEKLSFLHSKRIIHGDIKPSNILWTGEDFKNTTGEIKLLDLGLSVHQDRKPGKDRNRPLHFSMLYSAPELMLNEPELISEQTDLFSLGVCMYESFSGDLPYEENHPAVLLQMMLAVELKRKRRIPPKISGLISVLSAKPAFKKPVAQYTVEEAKELLRLNLEVRSRISSAQELKEKLDAIS
jgi:eukaryotic-like serine/threonine-protein kinase